MVNLQSQENPTSIWSLHGQTGWYAHNGRVQVLTNPHPTSIQVGPREVWTSRYLVWVGNKQVGEAMTLAEAEQLAAEAL